MRNIIRACYNRDIDQINILLKRYKLSDVDAHLNNIIQKCYGILCEHGLKYVIDPYFQLNDVLSLSGDSKIHILNNLDYDDIKSINKEYLSTDVIHIKSEYIIKFVQLYPKYFNCGYGDKWVTYVQQLSDDDFKLFYSCMGEFDLYWCLTPPKLAYILNTYHNYYIYSYVIDDLSYRFDSIISCMDTDSKLYLCNTFNIVKYACIEMPNIAIGILSRIKCKCPFDITLQFYYEIRDDSLTTNRSLSGDICKYNEIFLYMLKQTSDKHKFALDNIEFIKLSIKHYYLANIKEILDKLNKCTYFIINRTYGISYELNCSGHVCRYIDDVLQSHDANAQTMFDKYFVYFNQEYASIYDDIKQSLEEIKQKYLCDIHLAIENYKTKKSIR